MISEIVWIFGISAVGKETFIRKLIEETPKNLIDKFDWKDKNLIPIWESIDNLAHYSGDKSGTKREKILENIINNNESGIAIIKGQDIDITSGRVQELKEKMPKSKHRIIYLYTDLDIVYERCKKKFWWKDEKVSFDKFKNSWFKYGIGLIKSLDGFEVTAISNKDEKYTQISFPPKF